GGGDVGRLLHGWELAFSDGREVQAALAYSLPGAGKPFDLRWAAILRLHASRSGSVARESRLRGASSSPIYRARCWLHAARGRKNQASSKVWARSSAVEHLTFNQRVVGSIPTGLTNRCR